MLSSPSKRRKTSTTTSIPVSGSNTDLDQPPKPTTPTRASYLSPTKASLARSHPHLAQQNQRRSLTEPRGRKLKDDLLKVKNISEASNVLLGFNEESTTNTEDAVKDSDTVLASTQKNAASTAPRTEPRMPRQNRQPSSRHSAVVHNFVQPPIVPKLIRRFEGSTPAREPSPPERTQPQLPPTTVELGWQEPPERPKGLSSSSPRGSRSGSGRHGRRRNEQFITSSPLKPKDRGPTVEHLHDQESEVEMAEQEPQTMNAAQDVEQPPMELYDKQETLERLQADLMELKKSNIGLERALNLNEIEGDILDDADVQDRIEASLSAKLSFNTKFEQHITNDKEAAQYLKLFAPANLQLSSNTATRFARGQSKVVHRLTIMAPPPWAPQFFNASFDVTTDAETATVENIVWIDTLPGGSQSVGITDELYNWLDTCMKSELHGCNLGNLIWGVGQYFDKAVQRAKAFSKLSSKYKSAATIDSSDTEGGNCNVLEDGKPLNEEQALMLARYLLKRQVTIALPRTEEESRMRTRRVKRAEPRLLVNWRIELSWNAVARHVCEVTPSGIPDSAIQSVKELFERLYAVQGFEKAFDAVYELVKGEREATPAPDGMGSRQGSEAPTTKVKGRKRKRFT